MINDAHTEKVKNYSFNEKEYKFHVKYGEKRL